VNPRLLKSDQAGIERLEVQRGAVERGIVKIRPSWD